MRSFTVTKGDPTRFKVLPLIERYDWDPTFICDTAEQRASLISLGVARSAIAVTGNPQTDITGVSRARDYAARLVIPRGEWAVWIDDNVYSITGLPVKYSTDTVDPQSPPPIWHATWRAAFDAQLNPVALADHVQDTIARAEAEGTIYAAFANENNYYFRLNKWQLYGYCRTQLALYKNDGSTWFPFNTMMFEDAYKSLDVIARYGCVVINRHVKAVKAQFQPGGIGSFNGRLPHLQENCRRLVKMYPGLVQLTGDGSQYGMQGARDFHIKLVKRARSTVNRWRLSHGYVQLHT
jgi:hypothetical protein